MVFEREATKESRALNNVAGNWEKKFVSISLLSSPSLCRLGDLLSVVAGAPMGTVICHPSTDIAAQCSACLPNSFGSKRGTRDGNFPISFSNHFAKLLI